MIFFCRFKDIKYDDNIYFTFQIWTGAEDICLSASFKFLCVSENPLKYVFASLVCLIGVRAFHVCQAHVEKIGSNIEAVQEDLEAVIEDQLDEDIQGYVSLKHSIELGL